MFCLPLSIVLLLEGDLKNTTEFFLTKFLVEEGIKYKFGEITINNHVEKFDPEILYKNILFKTGQIYSGESI